MQVAHRKSNSHYHPAKKYLATKKLLARLNNKAMTRLNTGRIKHLYRQSLKGMKKRPLQTTLGVLTVGAGVASALFFWYRLIK